MICESCKKLRLKYQGKYISIGRLAKLTGLSAVLLHNRIKRGWTLDRALKEPAKKTGRPKIRNDREIRRLRKQGLSLRQIARKLNCSGWAVQLGLK